MRITDFLIIESYSFVLYYLICLFNILLVYCFVWWTIGLSKHSQRWVWYNYIESHAEISNRMIYSWLTHKFLLDCFWYVRFVAVAWYICFRSGLFVWFIIHLCTLIGKRMYIIYIIIDHFLLISKVVHVIDPFIYMEPTFDH